MMNSTCQSNNPIYRLVCNYCNVEHVGQTKNRIINRLYGHVFDIKHSSNATVARHSASNDNTLDPRITIHIPDYIRTLKYAPTTNSLWDKSKVSDFRCWKNRKTGIASSKKRNFSLIKGTIYWIVHDEICIFSQFHINETYKTFFLNVASSFTSLNQKKQTVFFLNKQISFIVPWIMCYIHKYKNLFFWKEYST